MSNALLRTYKQAWQFAKCCRCSGILIYVNLAYGLEVTQLLTHLCGYLEYLFLNTNKGRHALAY